MATEKYVPYKGVFGNNAVITATIDWFENSSELDFLWVFPNGETEMMSMNAASRAGKVVVNGNVVKISALTNYGTASECVFVYRSTMLKTKAMQVYEGVIPLSAILAELEEVRRAAEDAKTEAAKSLRVPEWSEVETHFPDKASRANKVMGFDGDGNPTTGEDCAQVKELLDAGKQCQVAVEQAQAQANEAKRQADIAGAHAHDANDSVAECVELLEEAELEANKAKTYAEKAASNGADSVNKARIAANEAMLANEQAQHAKEEVLAAKEDVAVKTQDLNKAVCYVACAASNVEARVEAAKQDLDATAANAKDEIAAFTDVYKKTETYSKSQIDGVDTGAEVVLKMNEIIAQLKDYEEVTGETLPNEFWVEVFNAFERWQANPNEVKEWVNTGNANENITSTCPYFDVAPTKPVVDFSVVEAKSRSTNGIKSLFGVECYETIFLPATKSLEVFVYSNQKANCDIIAPNTTSVFRAIQNAQKFNGRVYCPKATIWNNFAQGASLFNHPVTSQNATSLYMAFYGAKKYNQFTDLRSASNARFAFTDTAMSSESISKTLDSLPTWTDEAEHIITFTGSPGCAELTQESPSVAAAVAKGWTVEL